MEGRGGRVWGIGGVGEHRHLSLHCPPPHLFPILTPPSLQRVLQILYFAILTLYTITSYISFPFLNLTYSKASINGVYGDMGLALYLNVRYIRGCYSR